MTEEEKVQHVLATGLEEALEITELAQKFAPRDYAKPTALMEPVGQKRAMVPAEHFAESMMHLQKTLSDLQALRNKLLGEAPQKTRAIDSNPVLKKPVVALLHEQATDIGRISSEMSSLIAQIRDQL